MHSGVAMLGALVSISGAGIAMTALPRLAWRARVRRTTITPIVRASEGRAAFRGRVVPGEQGFLTSPVSDRRAVWFRVAISEEFRTRFTDTYRDTWHSTIERVEGRPFFLEDDSGGRARIFPENAKVYYGS